MAVDLSELSRLTPSHYTTFTLPNPIHGHSHLHSPFLRIAILDSPTQPATTTPLIAAMIVPLNRESDWIFSTFSGHIQLLGPSSRLILIGNHNHNHNHNNCPATTTSTPCNSKFVPPLSTPAPALHISSSEADLEGLLLPLVMFLAPKLDGFDFSQIPYFSYEDGVVSCIVVELCCGSRIGEMLVEDVEICDGGNVEFRRRLRFKRTPNLVQTQIRISSPCNNGVSLDNSVLIQPYLVSMVASLSLVGRYLDEKIRSQLMPKALCLGVGGGALLSFLYTRLGFEVVGVEEDEAVLDLARRHFGLPENPYINIHIGDGIELLKNFASLRNGYGLENCMFDVVMVDLDSSKAGIGAIAPPMEYFQESVLVATRTVLSEGGIVVLNIIPPSKLLYERLVGEFRIFFEELYEIDVGNEENFVLIASKNRIGTYYTDPERGFLGKLREACLGTCMESINKI